MLKKNEIIRLTVTGISSDGNGVGRYEGQAVFVPYTAVGDELDVRIVKVLRTYAYGIIDQLVKPSGDRIDVDCPHFGKCGGYCFRHISYEAEMKAKQSFVEDALNRLGGLSVSVRPIIPSPDADEYRNKVQFPVVERDGKLEEAQTGIRGLDLHLVDHRTSEETATCLMQ